jgi:leucine-rich repeat protein SHOC2
VKQVFKSIFFLLTTIFLFGCNPARKLEKAFNNPEGTTVLKLNNAFLTELPPEIGQLTNLETLVLTRNRLTELPPEIGNLTKLKKLVLSSNRLTSLPPEIGNLANLEYLSVKHNRMDTLPAEIGNLINLKWLDLQYNRLKELPPEIGNLKKIRFLYLNENHLYAVPDEIGDLEELRIFVLGKNRLTEPLPETLGNLCSLTELNVGKSGPMLEIPLSVQNLKQLDLLVIDETTIIPFHIRKINSYVRVQLTR